jgi:hypothetical protein
MKSTLIACTYLVPAFIEEAREHDPDCDAIVEDSVSARGGVEESEACPEEDRETLIFVIVALEGVAVRCTEVHLIDDEDDDARTYRVRVCRDPWGDCVVGDVFVQMEYHYGSPTCELKYGNGRVLQVARECGLVN